MEATLTRLTHRIAIQLHLVAESCTICSSRSRRPVWKLLDTPSYGGLNLKIVILMHNYVALPLLSVRVQPTYLYTYLLHGAGYYLKS
jgi:hypothetical protein